MPNFGSAVQTNKIPVLGLVPEKSATAPANPVAGQLWTDTSVTPPKVKWYDGTTWVAADYSSLINGYITNAHINAAAGIALSKLAVDPLARANHTGTQAAATISDFNTAVRVNRLDQLTAPTGAVDVNGQRLLNVGSPTAAGDGVNKAYVDNARAGIAGVKSPVRVAVAGNVNLNAPGTTLDGVSLTAGDRFLAPAQSTGTESGIYVFNGATSPATRPDDADGAGEIQDGTMVAVAEGTRAGYQYIQTATASGNPGTWTQTWVVFQMGGQTYTASTGLTQTGTTFALDIPVSVANGGTGSTTVNGARVSLGAVGRYAADLGALAAGAPTTITHGLNTTDVIGHFRTTSDGRRLDLDFAPTGVNTIAVYPDLAFAAGAVRAVVIG